MTLVRSLLDAVGSLTLPSRRAHAERELARTFSMSPALLGVAGFDGYLRRFNPAFEIFGYSDEELLSRPWIEFAHPDDQPRMTEAAASLERGQDVMHLENRVVCRDGSLRWIQWSTRVVPEEGLFYAAGRDVTDSRRFAQQEAALRRVATLVAREPAPEAVFAAVAREVGEVMGVHATHLGRYDTDETVVSVGQWGPYPAVPVGARFPLEGDSVSARVFRTGRPTRMDGYDEAPGIIAETVRGLGIRFSVGVPISVEGRTWGVMIATLQGPAPFPADAESRLHDFTELMATAIANAEARAEAKRLADEQTALRRVATLVARGAAPSAVFDAVTAEVVDLMDSSQVTLSRYDDNMVEVLAQRGDSSHVRIGDRFPVGGENATTAVLRTGRPARYDDFSAATGTIGEAARRSGAGSIVAVPVIVDGRTWGMLAAVWSNRAPPPGDAEQRLAGFAELLHSAIGNADTHQKLTTSRMRVLAAGDEARRRVVRDLHDGAQQRLVHTVVTLKLAQRALADGRDDTHALLDEALGHAERATVEVRELAHGILPAVLTRGGLRAGVDAVVSRLDLPVDVDVTSERLPRDIEASAYFVVAEALTNVIKHARATRVAVRAAIADGTLTLTIEDDGIGGADPEGHGLLGLADRVEALGGGLRIGPGAEGGTRLTAWLPTSSAADATDAPPETSR